MKGLISFLIVVFFLVAHLQSSQPEVRGESSMSIGLMVYTYAVNITGIEVSNYLPTAASVSWETPSTPSICVFSFGETDGYELGSFSESLASESHLANLSNLDSSTTYFYKIECLSFDGQGYGEAGSLAFETPDSEQIIDITNISTEADEDSVEIYWNTSEASICSIQLGETSLFEIGLFNENSYSISHSSSISGLSEDTQYYYRISCASSGGDSYGETSTLNFTTEKKSSDEKSNKKKDDEEAQSGVNYTSFEVTNPDDPGLPDPMSPEVTFPENLEKDIPEEEKSGSEEFSVDEKIGEKLGIINYLRTDIFLIILSFVIILISDITNPGKIWDRVLFILSYSIILVAVIATMSLVVSSGGTLVLNTIALLTEICLFIYGIKVINDNEKKREKRGEL